MVSVGEAAESTWVVTSDLVRDFARVSGDANPLHLDDEFASHSTFGRRIAHGMLPASFISALLGTELPGQGCIYLHQSLDFRAPVYIGDSVTARVEVIEVREDKPVVTMKTTAWTDRGTVVEGKAVLLTASRKET